MRISATPTGIAAGRRSFRPESLPGSRGRLTHGLEVRRAALLQQAADAAVEVLHAESQKLRDEIVGAATAGDASGARDDLDPTLHHLLHFRMRLLSGVAHGLRQVA